MGRKVCVCALLATNLYYESGAGMRKNMNPVLWILVLLAAVLLWFIISFIFVPLGRFVLKRWDNVMGILNNDEQKEDEEK